jgi:AraC-like DNA-binding protein
MIEDLIAPDAEVAFSSLKKDQSVMATRLEQRSGTVTEIAYQVGYSNLSYFSKSYQEAFGISPNETIVR